MQNGEDKSGGFNEVEELKRQIDIQAAINANVCSQYSGIICVDMDRSIYRYVDIKERNFMIKIPESGTYDTLIQIYLDNFVHPLDREKIEQNIRFPAFEQNAAVENGYKRLYLQFRRLYEEHYEWVELMLSRKLEGPHMLILLLRNIHEEKKRQMQQEKVLRKQNDLISQNYWKTVDLMASLLEHRSLESGDHIRRIKTYVQMILDQAALLYPEQHLDNKKKDIITNLSSLHDIGKIGIPDAILQKPGKLTANEYQIMQKHAEIGAQIANKIPNISADPLYVKMSCDICKYHHERYDGNGYPEGLRGDEIPFCAQIVAIADVYDALTSERVYKPAYSHQTAVRMILDGECGVFSDRLLTAFQNAVGGGGIYSYEMSMELTFIPGFVK